MDVSEFLAKLLGLYFIIVALIWMFRKKPFEDAAKEVFSGGGFLILSGAFSLLFGLAIVIDHSIWELNWKGLITLIGYLTIVKGVMRLAFPLQSKKAITKVMKQRHLLILTLLILGIYLSYNGFMGHTPLQ